MAFGLNNPILASNFIELKARVKAECERRHYNGSVAQYATAEYDYTSQPEEGGVPLPQHFNKILVPVNAIRNTGVSETKSGFLVRDYEAIQTLVGELEAIEQDASNAGCSASCTGLCQGTCTDTCTSGCSSGCKGSCKGSCSGSCSYQCIDTCKDVCASDCTATCGLGCSVGCVDTCSGSCTNTCVGGCINKCQGTCTGGAKSIPNS